MKKKLLLIVAIALSVGLIYTLVNQDSTEEKQRKSYAKFLKNHPYNKTLALTRAERKAQGIPPNKYFEQQYLLEMNPVTGRTHPENYLNLQKELKANKKLQRAPGDANDNAWVERGPNNVGGRTRVVMYDPNDATNKRVFAGGVSGGLWVNNDITDANSSWTRVGIDENLSVSSMTVDPNNSQIMYVGTGESYTQSQALGNGVWKSTDGGVSWINVFSDSFNADDTERLYYINDIKAWNNPATNKTEVFLGVGGQYYSEGAQWVGYAKTGLYKSIDDGATWPEVTLPAIPGESTTFEPNDIEIGIDNTIWIGTETNVYGDGGGTILKSTDGVTFTSEHIIADADRTEIAVSGTDASTIYVLVSKQRASLPPQLYKTTDAFQTAPTLQKVPNDPDGSVPQADFTRNQQTYNLVVEVDPTDNNIVYLGGINLHRSPDSGSTWTTISYWASGWSPTKPGSKVHADHHALTFHPTDPTKAILGTDGGVYNATDLSNTGLDLTTIAGRNKDYNTSQFYHGSIGQDASNELLLSGAQDNGTQFVNGATSGVNSSIDINGGDGAYSWIDKDGVYAIAAYVYNNITAYNLPYNGTKTEIISENGTTVTYTGSFINPTGLDDNLDILYANAAIGPSNSRSGAIFRFTDLTGAPVKTRLSRFMLDGDATALKVSPFTTGSSTLFVGTSTGKVLKLLNADTTPVWTDISGGSFSGSVSSIAFGANEDEILVTFHNYGVTSIWFTTDGGTVWTGKEGDFADIPVKAIMMNPLNNDEVIIGTQLGVWRTSNFKDASPKWIQSDNGMSNVKVTSFSLRTSDNVVMASTYGRGMFTGQFSAGVVSVDDVLADKKVFTLYPTVSDGDFTVFAKNTLGKSTVYIFDINGKQVFTKKVDFNQDSKQAISVNLKTGVYIVNLVDENNKKATTKMIIK